jgi:hypothetical protein
MKRIWLVILIILAMVGAASGQGSVKQSAIPRYWINQADGSAPTNNQVMTWDSTLGRLKSATASGGGGTWGSITGTLTDQVQFTATPTINKVPIASVTGGKLATGWIPDLSATYLPNTLGTGKGTLVGFSAANTPGTLAAGTNGAMLQADSTSTLGFKWVTVPAIDSVTTHFLDGTGTYRALASTDVPATPINGTITNAATIYPSSDGTNTGTKVNYFTVTACAGSTAFALPPGSWSNGDKLIIRIYAAGVQTLDFTTSTAYVGIVALPTTTAAGKYLYVGCIYNSQASKFDVVATQQQP